ncbi:carcinoembryonic antigen-related cell adhesion molecule 1-like [Hyla sarda]|uniref:carcinoembryonic antigen-related cell adhesion molecule 1-like n=1 Tax=Hyla sarda TaxID=327740 RepID=UPI0024C3AD7D|nr:carcinoembryonic antigen-related cell adhesion molecule 1-like [Hyla sarda]
MIIALGPKRTLRHQSSRTYKNPMDLLLWSVFLSTIGTASTVLQFNAAVGGTAFMYGNTTASPGQRIDWKIGTAAIATRLPAANPTYTGRCSGNRCTLFENGTIQMYQIVSADNTSFSVTLDSGIQTIIEQVRLNVYSPLSPPSLILSSSIRPVNGTSLNLRCNPGSQTVHSIYFYRDEALLSCSSSHLSCNSSSAFLYFNPILAIDKGNYSCGIENPVSSNRSSSRYLDVSVNVSAVTLRSNTTRPVTAEKEAVALTCSSYGTEVTYNWTLKGSPLPENPRYRLIDHGSTLVISPVLKSDQGEFTCRVSNYLNTQQSNPLNLTWSPDGNVVCGAERSEPSVQLYCLWPGAYPPAVVNLMYHNVNQSGLDTVTTEVPYYQFSLGRQLSCSGSHGGSTEVCSLLIDIPKSSGFINESLKTANKGNSAVLSVSLNSSEARAAQIFPATFSWFRLNPSSRSEIIPSESISIISNDYSSFLIVHSMSEEFNGQYTCKAQNPMGSSYFTFILDVKKEEETLSAGATAGIVIGCIAAVALVALVIVLIIRTRRTSSGKEINDFPARPTNHYVQPTTQGSTTQGSTTQRPTTQRPTTQRPQPRQPESLQMTSEPICKSYARPVRTPPRPPNGILLEPIRLNHPLSG